MKHAYGTSVDKLLATDTAEFRYDVAQWIADGMPHDASPYRLELPVTFVFSLPAESARDLAAAVDVWTTDLKGLSKLVTRIRPVWQEREARPLAVTALDLGHLGAAGEADGLVALG
jgi:hypothetical protein